MLIRRLSFLSRIKSSSYATISSLSSSTRPVHNPLTITAKTKSPQGLLCKATSASLVNVRNINSHGVVSFVISPEGKPKFQIWEPEPLRKRRWVTKKQFKMRLKNAKRRRKEASPRNPSRLTVKRKKSQKFESGLDRLKDKLERAKMKEASLIERLKEYEVAPVQGPDVKPHELTGEEEFYIKRMAQKRSNYVPVGTRGIIGGVILNMHLHWKRHETVKVICKHCKPGQLEEYRDDIARKSGGFPIQTIGKDTIVFYRGKNYEQPEVMSPVDTLSKKRAMEKSRYEQSLETVREAIEIIEKELKLYYRYGALIDHPNNHKPHTILGHSIGPRDQERMKDSSDADVRSPSSSYD